MTRRDIPNLITLVRILLVAPITYALLHEAYQLALLLFAVAAISDGLDGWLARRNGWSSRLGAILDPMADKLLLVAAYLSLGWVGVLPAWLVAIVMGRDLLIVAGAGLYRWLVGPFVVRPSLVSKLNTFFQILLVVAVVLSLALYPLSDAMIELRIGLVALTSLLSGGHYVWSWGRRAAVTLRSRQG